MASTKIQHRLLVSDQNAGGVSVFLMGSGGSWKTTWACEWPGICLITFANEQGDHAVINYPKVAAWMMERDKTYQANPGSAAPCVFNWEKPQHFRVRSVNEMETIVDDICKNHKAWKISTVCIDIIQYYIAAWIREFFELKYKSDKKWTEYAEKRGGEAMDQQSWGFLNVHLDGLRVKLSNEGLNTIWTAHSKEIWEPREDKPMIRELKAIIPNIQGGTRLNLPCATSLHIAAQLKHETIMNDPSLMGRDRTRPIYWTIPDKVTDIRHKYFDSFPAGKLIDPDFGDMPTFRAVWNAIGQYIYICR